MDWTRGAADNQILEPFAGLNSLIETLEDMDLCKHSDSFDISYAEEVNRETQEELAYYYEPQWQLSTSLTDEQIQQLLNNPPTLHDLHGTTH